MKKSHKILFTLSVALNLALIGTIAGHQAGRWRQDAPWQEIQKGLAPQTQEIMRKMFEEKREKIKANWMEMREKKKNMEAILSAPQFDAQAFDVAVQDWQAFNAQVTQSKMETFKTIMGQLPQEERAKLAEKFVKVLTGARDRRGGREGEKSHWKQEGKILPEAPLRKDEIPSENKGESP